MQVVRTSPDVEEDQRPEVNNRKAVGIDRTISPLRDEVVHDGKKASGQEEAHRIVTVPPLHHRILDTRPDDVGLGRIDRDRDRQVVDDVQHGDRDDKRQIEPVRHIDVRFLAFPQRPQEQQQVEDPDNGQPEIGVPFRFRVFLALGDTEHIPGTGENDENVVTQDHEPGQDLARHAHTARPLNDIHGRRQQYVAAEGENHRRCVQGTQPAEIGPGKIEIQCRPGQLKRDYETDRESGKPPEHGGDRTEFDRPHIVVRFSVDFGRNRFPAVVKEVLEDQKDADRGEKRADASVKSHDLIKGLACYDDADECKQHKEDGESTLLERDQTGLFMCHFSAPVF